MQNCELDKFALSIISFLLVSVPVFVLWMINLVLLDLKTIFSVDTRLWKLLILHNILHKHNLGLLNSL